MERVVYGIEKGQSVLDSANKTLKQFNGDKSQIGPLYNLQIEAANTLFSQSGFNPGISALDDAATQKEKIEKGSLRAVNDKWVEFNKIKDDNPIKAIRAGELQQLVSSHIDRFGTSKEAYEPILKGLNGWQENALKPKFRTFNGPDSSRLQVNETTGEEKTILGRKGEGGSGDGLAKQGAIRNIHNTLAERYIDFAKIKPSEANSLFSTDELGRYVNTARLRSALPTAELKAEYDAVKIKAEAYATKYGPSESVQRAIADYRKENPKKETSKGSPRVRQAITAKRPGGSGQAQASSAPPVRYLKEGQQTTFKNGEVWTLQNGKPVRIK
jgi:hypothetical protein